ncbi:Nodule Cysteine-Rich (NCR) secreted peptide [Medicago truncatula]|uniref:Nodule Cysteine-Rich (NCR) secreted peptide n=1 Tax=Medicago truncatula TaxID=3880 RepID=A0A072UGB9_MEDTR|nr:Nodule Cysteine-Rich (NCR) secreted peptide [Medicago truncatula]
MTTILKFAYVMIICLFLLQVAAQEVLVIHECNRDRDCHISCVPPELPKCIAHMCFCFNS